MKTFTILVALALASTSLYAQGRGNGAAKKPSPTTVAAAPKTAGAKGKAATPGKAAVKAERRVAKVETRGAKRTTKAETRTAKTNAKAGRKSAAPVTTTTVVTPTTPTTRAVKNPKLEARLLTLLPAGTNIQDASQGFKNWGQFVAAVHASNNLKIPFADLKTAMTGLTPGATAPASMPMSLGQAVQSLSGTTTTEPATLSTTKIKSEVKKAEDAASLDLSRTREGS